MAAPATPTCSARPKASDLNSAEYCRRDDFLWFFCNGMEHLSCEFYSLNKVSVKTGLDQYHRTLKNVVNLENYYLPWQPEHKIGEFVQYYNHQRVHESLDNLTPADVYYGRDKEIIEARKLVKEQTLRRRRRQNLGLEPLKEKLIKPTILRECVC